MKNWLKDMEFRLRKAEIRHHEQVMENKNKVKVDQKETVKN